MLKNLIHVISSNFISLFISIITIILIPKIIGVEEFGYWQLYMFYLTYVGLTHFGWNDGIYLRYGGENYKSIDKEKLFSQFYLLFISQVVMGAAVYFTFPFIVKDFQKIFIIKSLILAMILVNIRYFLLFVLQATNRLKNYSKIIVSERVGYFVLVVCFILLNSENYHFLIWADLITKLLSLIYTMIICKEIVWKHFKYFKFDIQEAFENVSVGSKVVFANISSMLIVGNIRFAIERTWDVSVFGKVSLMLSISNLMMVFINAIGIVLFPIIKKVEKEKLPNIYSSLRILLTTFLTSLLIFYYPLNFILKAYLPMYFDVIIYLALLFPIFVFEGRMGLLINTYLKAYREEQKLMEINILSLIISVILTILSTIYIQSLTATVLTILLVLAIRSLIADVYLSKILKVSYVRNNLFELITIVGFLIISLNANILSGIFVYLVLYIFIFIFRKNEIFKAYSYVKQLFY